MCTHLCVCPRARARERVCAKDKEYVCPGQSRGPSMFLPLGEVTGCLGSRRLNWRHGEEDSSLLSRSLSLQTVLSFLSFFFFF